MDKKGIRMLNRYWEMIAKQEFDEYNLMGFLILLRNDINKSQFPLIYDFLDLMAHRERNQGKAMDCIEIAVRNSYQTLPGTNVIKGYQGVDYKSWEAEWLQLANSFGYKLAIGIVKEITICVFSITQFTEYDNGKISGQIRVLRNKNTLSLCTVEHAQSAKYICFFQIDNIDFCGDSDFENYDDYVETRREDGRLRLRTSSSYII